MAVKKRTSPGIRRPRVDQTGAVTSASRKANRPRCPQHKGEMRYSVDRNRWWCIEDECPITAFQQDDALNQSTSRYRGALSVVKDERNGEVWLRLGEGGDGQPAALILLSDVDGGVLGLEGLTVDTTTGTANVVLNDVMRVTMSAKLRR